MWQLLPLLISVWVHVDVWKATSDIDGNAETIKSDNNVDTVPFQLG
jgi:hypothetical protein